MTPQSLTERLSVASQLTLEDLDRLRAAGIRLVINNRPDGEEPGQISSRELAMRAEALGLGYVHIPVMIGSIGERETAAFREHIDASPGPVLAFCRTGTRSAALWALSQTGRQSAASIMEIAASAGFDLTALLPQLRATQHTSLASMVSASDILIVGGGSAGLAVAASLLARDPALQVVVIEPRDTHFYQPGWTMVGGGIFDRSVTQRSEASVMPKSVRWVRGAVARFEPDQNRVVLQDGAAIDYRWLVVAPGIFLDWGAIEGLQDTLGKNGVTSNYDFDTAPYTWELVQRLKEGVALFTQPPMPIKCAGAPQKAMYLSCDHWRRAGRLNDIDVTFHNAAGVLFGVKDYVPALMRYVDRYSIDLAFESTLIAIDGPGRQAIFREKDGEVTKRFDMIHVTPPQRAPAFLAQSPLANEAGYADVDPETLQHVRYANVFGLGDGASTPNAKTMAAARKQAPIVAANLLAVRAGKSPVEAYDGYGSCPLTVERGRIVMAEFGYGGRLLPTFPKWLLDGTRPLRRSWFLKAEALPQVYWHAMLKGREWFVRPAQRSR